MQKLFRVIFLSIIFFAQINIAEAKTLPVIGVVDFVSRVTITNLSDEQVNTFQTAAQYLMDGLIEPPACAEVVSFIGSDTQAVADEILLTLQAGKIAPEIQSMANTEECDFLLVGFIMNLSRSTDEKIIGKGDGIRATLSAQLFEVSTGKRRFSFIGHGNAKSHIDRIGRVFRQGELEFSEDNLNRAMEQAVREIVVSIREKI